jgi:hypothetical protein
MQTERTEQDVAFGGQQQLTDQDVAYVTSTFRRQTEAEHHRAAARCAPKAAYLLPDGTPMVPAAPDEELDGASDPEHLHRRFARRWVDVGGRPEAVAAELATFLDGRYGVCLPSPGPEVILAKEAIAQAIAALIAIPTPQQDWWRDTLRCAVAAYDALVLPFASVDPDRFGQPTSRMILVDSVRERWPDVFTQAPSEP